MSSLPASGIHLDTRGAVVVLPDRDGRSWLDERAKHHRTEWLRRVARCGVLLTSDLVAGVAAIFTVIGTWAVVSDGGSRPVPDAAPLLAMVLCIMPLALRVAGSYNGGRRRTDPVRLAVGVTVAALVGWVQALMFNDSSAPLPNKTAYLYSALCITVFAFAGRLIIAAVIRSGFRSGRLQRRLVVVGSPHDAEELHARGRESNAPGVRLVGLVSPDPEPGELARTIADTRADGVIIAPTLPFETLTALINECFRLGVTVALRPPKRSVMEHAFLEVHRTAVGPLVQLSLLGFGLPQLAIKRTMDIVLTSLALAVLWPLLLVVAVAVKLDSKGPALFRQTRVGVGGRHFEILKFRTMVVGADALKASLQHLSEYPDARLFKIRNDPRRTRLGRILRKTSLDELPQLWNVLRGDMSLVGPRPPLPEEIEQYSSQHFERLFVVPGLTGPWQVAGRNEVLDFDEVVRIEREYIRNWSLWSDVLIVLRTIPTLLTTRGAS